MGPLGLPCRDDRDENTRSISSREFCRHASQIITALVLLACDGCGGGGAVPFLQQQSPPPPPAPDFTIAFSSSAISILQGATNSSISISVTALNGFSGSVQLTLNGMPAGVASNPASPFTLAASSKTALVFGAATNAATGNFNLSAQAVGGAVSHSAALVLTVQPGVPTDLPRTGYARTDSILAFDDPPGEPRHRRVAYDLGSKRVFFANRAMNRIEIFSATDQTQVGQISIPGAASVDLSADSATLWVGTVTQQAIVVDAASLHVRSRITVPALTPLPNSVFDRPEELLTLSNTNLMMRLRQSTGAEALLALWDPLKNTLTDLTSTAPQLFQSGVGATARTGDHTKLLVAANDLSGELAVLDANGSLIVGPHGLGTGRVPLVAANTDGSRFALEFVTNGAAQVMLFDAALTQLAALAMEPIQGLTFSRDGKFLYVSSISTPAISVLDANTLNLIGQVPDPFIQRVSTEIEEADETHLLFGIANRGLSFIDAAKSKVLSTAVPSFAPAPAVSPSEGLSAGGTSTSLSGQNFESTAQVKFGQQSASNSAVLSPTQLQAVSPPSLTSSAVNITAYFPSGWLALAPDAFSYGPQILKILPNAGINRGGDVVQIYGYGFGSDLSKISVKVGGTAASVQNVENISSITPSLGLESAYPFPIQRITLRTPPGDAGNSAIDITSPAGSLTIANAFQYFQSQLYGQPRPCKFLLYDQRRQWIYLSATDHVEVFDLATQLFHSTGLYPPGGPPQSSGLRGLSLTPDGTRLVAADFGAQSVYLLNPDTGAGITVHVGGVAGFLNSGPARVAATSTQTVFVSMSGEGGNAGACSSCLSQLNLAASPPTIQPAPQPEVTKLTGAPLVQANSAGDGVFLAYDTTPGSPVAVWSAATPNQFATSTATESAVDLAAAPDGTMFVTRTNAAAEIRGADLTLTATPATAELERVPNRVLVPGIAMHPSGALIYQPFLTAPPSSSPSPQGGIDILDAHSGSLRLRLFLSEPLAMTSADTDALHASFLAVDENGRRIFALTASGLTIIQLTNVPLGIGTISPASGPASGGATLTIRGSGFLPGTTTTIGGKPAAVTFKDMNTLSVVAPALAPGPQQIVVTNPGAETIILDAAFGAT